MTMPANKPKECSWCERHMDRFILIQMTTAAPGNRLTWKPIYLCGTDCLVEWASNLHVSNPEWHLVPAGGGEHD